MIRHISLFMFADTPEKAGNIAAVRDLLEQIPALYPAVRAQQVGTALPAGGPPPALAEDAALPLFGDLVQVVDFDTPEDAAGYPASEAHRALTALSGPMGVRVAAIDYEFAREKSSDRLYIEQAAARLGVRIQGRLTRAAEAETAEVEKCFSDEAGTLFRLRHGVLTVTDAEGRVY